MIKSKSRFLFHLLLLFFPVALPAEPFILKAGGGIISNPPVYIHEIQKKIMRRVAPCFRMEGGYFISPLWSVGIYGAIAGTEHTTEEDYIIYDDGSYAAWRRGRNSLSFFYGLKLNCYALPGLLNEHLPRSLDIYYGISTGGFTELWDELVAFSTFQKKQAHSFEYGLCTGIEYRISRRLGIYGEYSLGVFHNMSHHRGHAGLLFYFLPEKKN